MIRSLSPTTIRSLTLAVSVIVCVMLLLNLRSITQANEKHWMKATATATGEEVSSQVLVTDWEDAISTRRRYIENLGLELEAQNSRISELRLQLASHPVASPPLPTSPQPEIAATTMAPIIITPTSPSAFSSPECPLSLSSPTLNFPDLNRKNFASACVTHSKLLSTICQFSPFVVNPSVIDVNKGGEPLPSVMGQEEDVEYPKYSAASFRGVNPPTSIEKGHNWYLNKVMGGFKPFTSSDQPPTNCEPQTTFFIMRYEYVNLFHTMTDLFNSFETITATLGDPLSTNYKMVWLDGHPEGNLDTIWAELFNGAPQYVKTLGGGKMNEAVCFDHAVVVPAGYTSPIWSNNRNLGSGPCPALAERFANFVLTRFHLEETQLVKKRVVIIDRQPYTAHPRSKPHMPRKLGNIAILEAELVAAGGDVHVVKFETMSFSEQLREVREASVLVGVHGAGLTHMLFMSDGAYIVELAVNGLDMFQQMEKWKDKVGYHRFMIGEGGGGGDYIVSEQHRNEIVKLIVSS